MKTKIENGIEYMLENNIWYPTFKTKENGIRFGKYGMMRKEFLAQNRQTLYDQMALAGNLYSHCKEIEDNILECNGLIIENGIDDINPCFYVNK